jgi:hypothetical protein
VKKSCLLWLAAYLLLAVAIGEAVHRRYPGNDAAGVFFAGGIGGFLAVIGFGYLFGIPRKISEAFMIRRALNGDSPRDGRRVAAIGRINPISTSLVAPFSRTSCVAYKYEVHSGGGEDTSGTTIYNGFALSPSAIQGTQGSIRLLAYPALNFEATPVTNSSARQNAAEYFRGATFREYKIGNIRAAFSEMMKDFRDDDGSIRTDNRNPGVNESMLQDALFTEWLLKPGAEICAIGLYDSQRGGLVPDPRAQMEPVTITRGVPAGFTGRAVRSIVGYIIGALIFIGLPVIGLTALYTFVPLDAAEQVSGKNASWPEIRLEPLIEKHLRAPLREASVLDNSVVSITLERGTARGRIRSKGIDETLERAEAVREGGHATVRIDGDKVVLTIDEKGQPLQLRLLGEEIVTAVDALDLRISDNNSEEVTGRLTYLPSDVNRVACRVVFRARVQ